MQKSTSTKKRKKMALGRGLGALIPAAEPEQSEHRDYVQCDVDLIQPNRYQPRKQFPRDDLEQLSLSIREQGIIQPLLVRNHGNSYELVTGERRLRAARLAGFTQVPVIIRDLSDLQLLEMSIVENIQREDLNPIEEAEAYYRLISEFNLTQDQVADKVGKSRPAVANFLRLRQLPDPIKESLMDGKLSSGHARALLGIDTAAGQIEAWRVVMTKELSVRETEALIKRLKARTNTPPDKTPSSNDIYFTSVGEDLSRRFGTKVRINRKGKRGKLEIEFYSNDDLDRILTMLNTK